MNEDNINLKNDMQWDDALIAMIHLKEEKDSEFDGKYILPINAYPELIPICAYKCLQYIHECRNMKITLNQEELTHAVVCYMVGKGYQIEDSSIEFQGDDYEVLESLECEIQVIKEPNQ